MQYLTATHEIHLGANKVVAPGEVFVCPPADLAFLLRVEAARMPSEDELKLAGVIPIAPFALPEDEDPKAPKPKARKAAAPAALSPSPAPQPAPLPEDSDSVV